MSINSLISCTWVVGVNGGEEKDGVQTTVWRKEGE